MVGRADGKEVQGTSRGKGRTKLRLEVGNLLGATKGFPTTGYTSGGSVWREMCKSPIVVAAFLVYHDFIMIS